MNAGARTGYLERRSAGFTVFETMIVLAVTGALFVIIAATLSGRQNAAEFTHAIQSIQSQIQQVIDQSAEGFFPDQNVSCSAGAGTLLFAAGGAQGANEPCVFLGKVIQFGVHGTNPEQYQIYTIGGLRAATAGAGSPFQNANPTVVAVGGNYAGYSSARPLEYGLTVAWVRSDLNSGCTVASCSIGAVGFLMEPGDFGSSSGYNSGAQQVDLVPIRTTNINQTLQQVVTGIESSSAGAGGLRDPNLGASAPINPSSGVQICFVSAGTNQSGLITIGSAGRQLLVQLQIKSNKTCA